MEVVDFVVSGINLRESVLIFSLSGPWDSNHLSVFVLLNYYLAADRMISISEKAGFGLVVYVVALCCVHKAHGSCLEEIIII